MALEISQINIGLQPDDGTGDAIRNAFNKVNQNFSNTQILVNNINSSYANTVYSHFSNVAIDNIVSDVYMTGVSLYIDGSPVATSTSAFAGGTVPGSVLFSNLNNSSSTITGAVQIRGGVGIDKKLYVGGPLTVTDNTSQSIVTSGGISTGLGAAISGTLSVGDNSTLASVTASGAVLITNSTNSSNYSTGALIISGGVGIAKDVNIDGSVTISKNLTITGSFNATNTNFSFASFSASDSLIDLHKPDVGNLSSDDGKDIGLVFNFYKPGQGASKAALVWANDTTHLEYYGSGVESGSGTINPGTYGTGKFGEFWSVNTTVSTSTVTGAIRTAGGLGVAGNTFVGGNLVIANTNPSLSTSTGALVVQGGFGISGAINAGSTLTVAGNTAVNNTLYARGIYDNSARVVSTSSGNGNLRITSNGWVALSEIGSPGSYGSSSSVPVITVDNYGRIVSVTTAAIAGGGGGGSQDFVRTANVSGYSNTLSYATGTFFPTFSNVVGGNTQISVSSGISYNVATGNLNTRGFSGTFWGTLAAISANVSGTATVQGNIVAASQEPSVSTNTGALVVNGGIGIAGAVMIGGNTVIANSTASISTTTGAFVVLGGVGIAGRLNLGGNIVTSSTASSSKTTGAIVVPGSGGVGVGGQLTAESVVAQSSIAVGSQTISGPAAGSMNVYGRSIINSAGANVAYRDRNTFPQLSALTLSSDGNDTSPISGNVTSIFFSAPQKFNYNGNGAAISNHLGNIKFSTRMNAFSNWSTSQTVDVGTESLILGNTQANIPLTTVSTNTTSGALIVGGGVGISGNTFIGGNLVVSNTNPSISTTTGALVVQGGVGVAGAIYATAMFINGQPVSTSGSASFTNIDNTPIGSGTPSTGAFTTLSATSGITGTLQTASQTNITAVGTLSTLSVSGSLSVGGAVTTSSTLRSAGNIVAASGTSSTNTTTGALVVVGGAGVSGSIYAGSLFDSGARVVSTSSGAGNLTISGSAISLTTTGGSGTFGSATQIPQFTTDAYGRVISVSNISLASSDFSQTANTSLYASSAAYTTGTFYPTFSNIAGGNTQIGVASGFTYNAATGNLTTAGFVGTTWGAVAATTANVGGTLTVGGNTAITNTLYAHQLYSGGQAVLTSATLQNFIATANTSLYASSAAYTTGTFYPTFSNIAGGNTQIGTASGFTYNAATGNLTTAGLVGTVWGAVAATTANVGGTLVVGGNTAINNTLYAQGVYDNSVRVVSTSSGAGNLIISGSAVNLRSHGPGASTLGSVSAYPIISVDDYGRVTGVTSQTTVNSVTAGTGISIGGTASAPTVSLASGVATAGSATYASITVDAFGRVTSYSSGTAPSVLTISSSAAGNLTVGGTTSARTINLNTHGPGAGSFGTLLAYPIITVDDYGRITGVTTQTTVNSVTAAAGITVGGTASAPTVGLTSGVVTAGSATYASITVDTYGRVTAISSGASPVTSVTAGAGITVGGTASAPSVALTSGVATAGSATYASITVDTYGRVTSFSSGTPPGVLTISSSGAGNVTIGGTSGARTINLNTHGPGASTLGSTSSYPIVSIDEYGRVTGVTTQNTVNSVTAGAGITVGGTASAPTVALTSGVVTAGSATYASITVDAYGRVTALSSGTAPVTSITQGTGITVTGTTTPTVALASGVVTAGSATYASITVDTYGRVTALNSGAAPVTSVGANNGITSSGGTTPTLGLTTTGVTAGSYGSASAVPVIAVDAQGRITSASTVAVVASSATNIAGGSAGVIHYQSGVGATGFSAATTSAGQLLQSGTNGTGQPSWIAPSSLSVNYAATSGTASSAGSATTATSLSAGAAGQIPYQSAVSTTAFTAAGTSGQLLQSGGTAAPTWVAPSTLTVGTANKATDLNGGTGNSIVYQYSVNNTAFLAAGTAGFILQTNGTNKIPSWVDPGTIVTNNWDWANGTYTKYTVTIGGGGGTRQYGLASGTVTPAPTYTASATKTRFVFISLSLGSSYNTYAGLQAIVNGVVVHELTTAAITNGEMYNLCFIVPPGKTYKVVSGCTSNTNYSSWTEYE